ncbi:Ataxin-3 [Saguinus oedipus]|uniref:ubiquitinyl hydrolase 1 n=1 Tax=Saguinus oedipus TaxID=9490 RepID=A0ABQ9U1T1_SAGOE|nr:Ataxin-3 [Saguinus oedipus]
MVWALDLTSSEENLRCARKLWGWGDGVCKALKSAAALAFMSSGSEVNPAPKFHWETLRHGCFCSKKTSGNLVYYPSLYRCATWKPEKAQNVCSLKGTRTRGLYELSPVELSSIAHQLDEEEKMRMAGGGVTSEDYHTFLQQPSGNMDDSGFFSIQVISIALKVWGLELILFNSPEYQRLRIDPINERSFICNYKEHWFTVRKLGKQWFNLNSLLTGPELISDTYLALFLAQLQQEGYFIFVVKGDLPDCEADQLLQMIRVQQMHRPKLIGEELAQLKEQRVHKTDLERVLEANDGSGMLDEDEEDLQRALALSRQEIDM